MSGEVKKNRGEVKSLISGKTHKQNPHTESRTVESEQALHLTTAPEREGTIRGRQHEGLQVSRLVKHKSRFHPRSFPMFVTVQVIISLLELLLWDV